MNVAHAYDSLVGSTLGNYEVSTLLGGGPYGRVFFAKHRERDFACALKVFDVHRCTPTGLRRVVEVSRSVAALPGTHACAIYESFPDGPHPYFALELVGGESLESLRRRRQLDWALAHDIFTHVAGSLEIAHRAGLVHGNLKPTNLRIFHEPTGKLSVRLLDWGFMQVRDRDDGDTRVDVDFAVDYLGPEQIQGAPPSPASDLYTLGVVLFEAVTGQRPFRGPPNVVAMHHMRTAPPSPRALVLDLPLAAETLILGLLDKDPHRRLEFFSSFRDAPRPPPCPYSGEETATEVFRRPSTQSSEVTVISPSVAASPGRGQAETVVLQSPQGQPLEPGAVTIVIPATQGPYILDTDPGLAERPRSEVTSIGNNSSATVFVKPMPPVRPPAASSPPRPTWMSRLKGPWSLESKLLTLIIILILVIVVGFFAASRT